MLTGDPPHTGATAQQIIMKIIAETPRPVTELRRSVPEHVAAALAQALEKLPADRFATAKAFTEALQGRSPGGTVVTASGRGRLRAVAPRRLLLLALGLAALLLAAVGFGAVQWRAAHRVAPTPVVRFHIELPSYLLSSNAAAPTNLAVSPDGLTIAYTLMGEDGAPHLFVRGLDQAEDRLLPGTEGAVSPAFSPDGAWVAYIYRGSVWKVSTAGGAPVLVGATGLAVVGLTWSASHLILIGTHDGILGLPETGGQTTLLAAVDSAAGELYFNQPRALPDGDHILFAIQPFGGLVRDQLAVYSIRTGKIQRLGINGLDPLMYVDGALVYVTPAGALMATALDLDRGVVHGNPVTLGPAVTVSISGASQAAMAAAGTLVYQPANGDAQLGWADLRGQFTPLITTQREYAFPRLSPDGGRIAMSIGSGGRSDIWVYDIASGTPTRLTSSATLNDRPEWSPDGRQILYRTDSDTRTSIRWQPADLSGSSAPLQADPRHDFYEGIFSPDGRALVYQIDDAGESQADVMYRGISGDTTPHVVSATQFAEAQPRVSPDGRWVAFVTDASGTSQVVVQPFPGPGGQVQISVSGGSEPVWSRDGRRLFYRDGRGFIAASLATTPTLAVTARAALFPDRFVFTQAPHANYDVSLDGTRFLVIRGASEAKLQVVYGWRSELVSRMRGVEAR